MYYIVLDPHDGDLLELILVSPGHFGFKSTFSLLKATGFSSLEEADHMMNELDLKSIQPDAKIIFGGE